MSPNTTSYYPPRAQDRWLPRNVGRRIDRAGVWLRVQLARSPLGTPMVLSLTGAEFLLCLLIPGEPYRRLGQRALGNVFLIGWLVCGLGVLFFLDSSTGLGWMVSGMASCHASGLGFLALREREASRGYPEGLAGKILIPMIAWALCAFLIYWPGYKLFETTVARPLFIPAENRSVIFNSLARPSDLQRNDLVAYKNENFRVYGGRRLAGGLMMGRVIGLPGDRVEFGARRIRVNGHDVERLPTMPTRGDLVVASDEWLVWPTVKLPGFETADADAMSDLYLPLAHVPQQNFVGRAFHRWFFQRQDQP